MDTFEPNYQRQSKAKLVAAVVAIVVIAGVIVVIDHVKSSGKSTNATQNTATTDTTSGSSAASGTSSNDTNSSASTTTSSSYKDGTYTVTSDYFVPPGQEEIQVSLTVQNGVVTSSSIQNSEHDHDSASFQEAFATEYKSAVVGKALSGLDLNTVAGASETTQGFNDALSQIRTKAQA